MFLRFVNELGTRGYVTSMIRSSGDEFPVKLISGREQMSALIVLNDAAVEIFDREVFNFYVSRNIIREYRDAAALSDSEGSQYIIL